MARLFGVTAAAIAILTLGTFTHARPPISYQAFMSGPAESPTNASPGTGYGTVDVDTTTHMWHLHATFSGLTGTTTASHIHSPTPAPFTSTAGVATTTPSFALFPLGVSSGTYDNTLDMTQSSSYNPAYVSANGGTTTSAELALASQIAIGEAYWNIHSTTFGGGEIRGFLIPIPEPACAAVLGAFGLIALRRKQR